MIKILSSVFSGLVSFFARYPRIIALFGFISGVASFFLVEREQESFAQIVSLLMLVSWVWLTLENLLHKGVTHWFGLKLPDPVLKFATQLVHQESLFFVIPFFFITTSWNSPQLIFTGLLVACAGISVVDPLYYKWLARRRWLYFFFHGFTLFTVLLTALPIIFHVPTASAYVWSLVIAIILSFLNVVRELRYRYWQRALLGLALITSTFIAGVLLRSWVPPATLWLTHVAITQEIDDEDRAPKNSLKTLALINLDRGLYAFTSIHAPRGLNERIHHVWYLNGKFVDKIPLDIRGGRDAGYRAWSHKMNFPLYSVGRWRIEVVTNAKQVIGVLRFDVLENHEHNKNEELAVDGSYRSYETAEEALRKPFFELLIDEALDLLSAMGTQGYPLSVLLREDTENSITASGPQEPRKLPDVRSISSELGASKERSDQQNSTQKKFIIQEKVKDRLLEGDVTEKSVVNLESDDLNITDDKFDEENSIVESEEKIVGEASKEMR